MVPSLRIIFSLFLIWKCGSTGFDSIDTAQIHFSISSKENPLASLTVYLIILDKT